MRSRCTLASAMLTQYRIYCKRADLQQLYLAVIEEQIPMRVHDICAKNFPVTIGTHLCTLKTLVFTENFLRS